MKDKSQDEEKILAEIRRRVIEHDSSHQEKEDQKSLHDANLQALDEMSSLNKKDIALIANQVRKEFAQQASKRNGKIVLAALVGAAMIAVGGIGLWVQRTNQQALEARRFSEPFDDNRQNWGIFNDIKYDRQITDGSYVFKVEDEQCYWDKIPIALPTHYAVELISARKTGEKKAEYGIALVAETSNNMLAFSLYPDGETMYGHYRNDVWEKTSAWSTPIANPGPNANTQLVEVKDNRSFKYSVNGLLVWEDTFSRTVPTRVGMRSCDNQTVEFQRLRVINLANNQTIFEDDFGGASSKKWNPRKEVAKVSKIENGSYYLETNTTNYCESGTRFYQIKPGEECDIVLKMHHVKGETGAFGLKLMQDATNFLTFGYKNNGKAQFAMYQVDKYTYLGNEKPTDILSAPGKPNITLKVEIRKGTCQYFINDILIDAFELNPDLKLNQVALNCCGVQQVAFDDLQIIPK